MKLSKQFKLMRHSRFILEGKSKMQSQKPLMEQIYKQELDALKSIDDGIKPKGWSLSPRRIREFILGREESIIFNEEKVIIKRKFYGDDALVERAIVTLAGNRGLMLVGDPGTAKTMLSELLSAAISGCSTNTIQGTAGTTEDVIKYSWNYAQLLAQGPSLEALVPGPVFVGMTKGMITRFEEITRCPLEVQDTLISIMSDKLIIIPELESEGVVFANQGFNIIATANTRDKGINEMSSALKRRFNFETVCPISSVGLEKEIILNQCKSMLQENNIEVVLQEDVAEVLATIFHELREGKTIEGSKIMKVSSVMSTAEAVSVYYQSALSSFYYSNGKIEMSNLCENLIGTVLKESKDDLAKVKDYFQTVVKARSESEGGLWEMLYASRKKVK